VKILEVHPRLETKVEVRFSCAFGEAVARWASGSPTIDGDYDVELEVADQVEWSRTGAVVHDAPHSISVTADGVRICGTIDNVQEDGVVALRLGGSLCLVESVGEVPPPGSSVCFLAKDIALHAYDA
jgi:hypothetical protein